MITLDESSKVEYDQIAEWYDHLTRSLPPAHLLAYRAAERLVGVVAGLEICDLACGQGDMARRLAGLGAHVTGIDISQEMLRIGRERSEADGVTVDFVEGDAMTLSEEYTTSFDGVVCLLALMDIPDLDAVLNSVYRILRLGGWFVFAITHPCFQTPDSRWTGKAGGTVKRELRRYFREGFWQSDNPNGVRGKVGAYHRTLSTYLNALHRAGLLLEEMIEPQADDALTARVPGYAEAPPVLIVRCRKGIDTTPF